MDLADLFSEVNYSIGINAAGFDNPTYNIACSTILVSPPDKGYEDAVRLSQTTFAENQTAIPLYLQPRVVPHSMDFCGLELDPSSLTVFWNIENFRSGESCLNF